MRQKGAVGRTLKRFQCLLFAEFRDASSKLTFHMSLLFSYGVSYLYRLLVFLFFTDRGVSGLDYAVYAEEW